MRGWKRAPHSLTLWNCYAFRGILYRLRFALPRGHRCLHASRIETMNKEGIDSAVMLCMTAAHAPDSATSDAKNCAAIPECSRHAPRKGFNT